MKPVEKAMEEIKSLIKLVMSPFKPREYDDHDDHTRFYSRGHPDPSRDADSKELDTLDVDTLSVLLTRVEAHLSRLKNIPFLKRTEGRRKFRNNLLTLHENIKRIRKVRLVNKKLLQPLLMVSRAQHPHQVPPSGRQEVIQMEVVLAMRGVLTAPHDLSAMMDGVEPDIARLEDTVRDYPVASDEKNE
ncbi:hypothetical protein BGX33_003341 [Mortierella sp. NVP41]|nr:hypothetical protein BGX33_003341 [Mortierella sp. NVP41]